MDENTNKEKSQEDLSIKNERLSFEDYVREKFRKRFKVIKVNRIKPKPTEETFDEYEKFRGPSWQ